MKTFTAKKEDVERRWYVVDAEGETLGRLAVRIADVLRGKRKPEYTPHVDTGDFVVVVNAEKIQVTGNRKTSVARVILRPGDGAWWINGRSLDEYFPREALRVVASAPLRTAGVEGQFDGRGRIHRG